MQLGVLLGRNYGESAEAALAPFRGTEKIRERSRHDFDQLLNLLLRERIDIILALPMEVLYAFKKAGVDREKIIFFTIKNGKKVTTAYIACNRNDWGYAVIEKINAVIRKKRPDFAKFYRDWLDQSSVKIYEQLVWEAFQIDISQQ